MYFSQELILQVIIRLSAVPLELPYGPVFVSNCDANFYQAVVFYLLP